MLTDARYLSAGLAIILLAILAKWSPSCTTTHTGDITSTLSWNKFTIHQTDLRVHVDAVDVNFNNDYSSTHLRIDLTWKNHEQSFGSNKAKLTLPASTVVVKDRQNFFKPIQFSIPSLAPRQEYSVSLELENVLRPGQPKKSYLDKLDEWLEFHFIEASHQYDVSFPTISIEPYVILNMRLPWRIFSRDLLRYNPAYSASHLEHAIAEVVGYHNHPLFKIWRIVFLGPGGAGKSALTNNVRNSVACARADANGVNKVFSFIGYDATNQQATHNVITISAVDAAETCYFPLVLVDFPGATSDPIWKVENYPLPYVERAFKGTHPPDWNMTDEDLRLRADQFINIAADAVVYLIPTEFSNSLHPTSVQYQLYKNVSTVSAQTGIPMLVVATKVDNGDPALSTDPVVEPNDNTMAFINELKKEWVGENGDMRLTYAVVNHKDFTSNFAIDKIVHNQVLTKLFKLMNANVPTFSFFSRPLLHWLVILGIAVALWIVSFLFLKGLVAFWEDIISPFWIKMKPHFPSNVAMETAVINLYRRSKATQTSLRRHYNSLPPLPRIVWPPVNASAAIHPAPSVIPVSSPLQ